MEWDRDLLRGVMRTRALGAAAKLAYLWLWDLAGGRPGRLVIDLQRLAVELGRDKRSAKDWIAALGRRDLVAVIAVENDTYTLDVYWPHPADRPVDRPAQNVPGVSAQKPPGYSHENPPGISAQKPPQESAEKKTAFSREKTPVSPKTDRPQTNRHGDCFTKDQENKKTSYQGTNSSKVNWSDFGSPTCAEGTAPVGAAPIGAALADVVEQLAAAAEPAEQKARLVARYRRAAGRDPEGEYLAPWVAGAAADLVVFHGLPDGLIEQVLVDIQALRAAGSLANGPGLFHRKVSTLAAKHGKPWPGATQSEIRNPKSESPCR